MHTRRLSTEMFHVEQPRKRPGCSTWNTHAELPRGGLGQKDSIVQVFHVEHFSSSMLVFHVEHFYVMLMLIAHSLGGCTC